MMRPLPPLLLLATLAITACDRARDDEVERPIAPSPTLPGPTVTSWMQPESVFTRSGRLAAYTQPNVCIGRPRDLEGCQVDVAVKGADGTARLVHGDSLEYADGVNLLSGLTLSMDERTLYFLGPFSPSMSGLHVIDLATAKHRFIASALSIEIIEVGTHRGKLMLLQYPYRDNGRVEIYVVVDPVTGQKLEIMPDTANATEWRKRFGL